MAKRWIMFMAGLVLCLPPLATAGELRSYTVAGLSMSPALMPGDRVEVSSEGYGPVERGDLVAIALSGAASPMVKRVVALPGDRVEMKGDALMVNGIAVQKIGPHRWRATIGQLRNYNWAVPERTFFVLGDNPENSRDSRRLGLIPAERVTGKVVRVIKKSDQMVAAH